MFIHLTMEFPLEILAGGDSSHHCVVWVWTDYLSWIVVFVWVYMLVSDPESGLEYASSQPAKESNLVVALLPSPLVAAAAGGNQMGPLQHHHTKDDSLRTDLSHLPQTIPLHGTLVDEGTADDV